MIQVEYHINVKKDYYKNGTGKLLFTMSTGTEWLNAIYIINSYSLKWYFKVVFQACLH